MSEDKDKYFRGPRKRSRKSRLAARQAEKAARSGSLADFLAYLQEPEKRIQRLRAEGKLGHIGRPMATLESVKADQMSARAEQLAVRESELATKAEHLSDDLAKANEKLAKTKSGLVEGSKTRKIRTAAQYQEINKILDDIYGDPVTRKWHLKEIIRYIESKRGLSKTDNITPGTLSKDDTKTVTKKEVGYIQREMAKRRKVFRV